MRRWVTGIVAISIGLGGVALYFGAGAYDMGADAPHWDVTRRVIETIRDRSIAAHSRNIDLPELQDEQRVSKSRSRKNLSRMSQL
ncbi:hypothetical protein FNL55_06075 [Tardiphaga sp. vice352]|uniref:hypothetical protein n=1 Tax=Tardiphaga sp. vice352 TaxID=2592816 RepID=UPI0011637E84|nr:hypothetical protein [Tardiphaga sp. vice352]QDM30927.1 hypothetical protein FNL55_06075 [Tardiphaga sp. vice352]